MVVVAEDFGTQLENSSAEERTLQEIQAVLVEVVLQAEVHQVIQAIVRQEAQLQAVTEDVEEAIQELETMGKP